MSDQDDALLAAQATMTQSIADIASALVDHDVAVQAELAALAAALAGTPVKDDPVVTRVIQAISDGSTSLAATAATLKTETAALAASVAPPVAVPDPGPAPTAAA